MKKNRKQFLEEVISQIRSREAKKYVTDELVHHLKEAKKSLIDKGMSEVDAEEKAIMQMGNPTKLGQQMNKLHRLKVDWLTVILLVTTLCFGILPIISISNNEMTGNLIGKKIMFVIIGVLVALVVMLMDYRKLRKYGWAFYCIGVFIQLILQLFPNLIIDGHPLIKIESITTAVWLALPFFFLAWASLFDNNKLKIWQFIILFFLSVLLFFSVADSSTAYIYIVMVFIMFFWSKFSRKVASATLILTSGVFLILVSVFWNTIKPYQYERVIALFNPEKYSGSMTFYSKKLLSKAGWFGNHSTKEMIPEAHTNLVFVQFTFYYGWFLAVTLVLIFLILIGRIITYIPKIHSSYGKLLIIGAVSIISIQFVSNMLMILGYFPMTTMSVPFLS